MLKDACELNFYKEENLGNFIKFIFMKKKKIIGKFFEINFHQKKNQGNFLAKYHKICRLQENPKASRKSLEIGQQSIQVKTFLKCNLTFQTHIYRGDLFGRRVLA